MKLLENRFRKRKMDYNQIAREGDWAVYSKTADDWDTPSFEVIEIVEKGEVKFLDRIIPEHEHYPSESEWGKRGWTHMTLDAAMKDFNERKNAAGS